ncbi:MAG: YdcF family protein [Rhizobiaceae bacterium]|nr:YdcF family protein [Rhizobiaceae bacterium]
MFYYLSKIAWLFLQPLNLSILLLAAGLIALLLRRRRLAGTAVGIALAVLVLSAWTSVGALVLHPLEDRFERPVKIPDGIAGIIVLGGGLEGAINQARGGYELNRGGDRMVEAAALARRLPGVPVIVSGGGGSLFIDGEPDANSGTRLLIALGIEEDRLVLESRSRNTYENAQFTRDLLQPDSSSRWLLVTSAFHMPRSAALFRKAGFDVVAWPVDYRTTGREGFGLASDNAADALDATTLAIREWIGLLAYRMAGRIDSLLPGP